MGAQHSHAVCIEGPPRGKGQGLHDPGSHDELVDYGDGLQCLQGAAQAVQQVQGIGNGPGEWLAFGALSLLCETPSAARSPVVQEVDVGAGEDRALEGCPQVELGGWVIDNGERGE